MCSSCETVEKETQERGAGIVEVLPVAATLNPGPGIKYK
jgi:hypothetical protein